MGEALIVSDPKVLMGKPVVAGTRLSVEFILEELAAGTTVEQLLEGHPRLSREAISAALEYHGQPGGSEAIQELGKLAPSEIRANLMRASLFLATYELFKIELIENVKAFYATDFDQDKRPVQSEGYRREVLTLAPTDRDGFHASCQWWVNNGQLTPDDVTRIKTIRDHRNLIAHELPKLLIDPASSVDLVLFAELRRYITVLGRFWGRATIDSDPQYDHQNIPDSEIESGSMLLVRYIAQLVDEQHTEPNVAPDPVRI